MRIHSLQHVPFEGLCQIQNWADDHRHSVTSTAFFRGGKLPSMDSFDMVVVMGGPMGANDEHLFPWLKTEKIFIEEAIQREKHVLGICLGAQLVANVLGARVFPNREKEIGWFPIELNPPNVRQTALRELQQRSIVFHWHGDTFEIPVGALHLARSRACENQAFSFGNRVMALQFHLEVSAPQIEKLIQNCPEDRIERPFVQEAREMMDSAARMIPPLTSALYRFLDAFTASPRV